jgi:hypothetical protein
MAPALAKSFSSGSKAIVSAFLSLIGILRFHNVLLLYSETFLKCYQNYRLVVHKNFRLSSFFNQLLQIPTDKSIKKFEFCRRFVSYSYLTSQGVHLGRSTKLVYSKLAGVPGSQDLLFRHREVVLQIFGENVP